MFRSIPNEPGVYFMLGKQGEILYIGKAKRLKRRLASYRNVKPATHPPHLVEMVGRIQEIRWEICRSERAALARENELLHAVRPPYNIADTEPQSYFFITARKLRKEGFFEFQLTSEPELGEDCEIFGCYKNRIQTKRGFVSLLRLIFSAGCEARRFSIPSRLSRSRVAFAYTLRFPEEWYPELSSFLRGESLAFLRQLTERLVENENVPRFMGPSLQDDIDRAREFFRSGPKASMEMKREAKLRARVLSHTQMDDLIARTLPVFESKPQS